MSKHNEITDEEFVPLLHSLGVETYKKSFEWMLSDPTFSGVFSWLYNNLDHNNALSAREEYRYAELKKLDKLLSPEDLNATLSTIQQDFPGICLPGDHEWLEDVKFDISMQKERLNFLEKEDKITNNLVKQNETSKDQLTIEITKLNAAQQQYTDDEATTASECLALAEEVEKLTEGVIDVIADGLDMYANCHLDKDIAKKFLSFGPLKPYRQSQALFCSHFELFVERKLIKRQNDGFDEDLTIALAEARKLEGRLSDAALAYIESKADLCGAQTKLDLVSAYNNVHPSQISDFTLEAQSALELLEQEEAVMEQQVQSAVKQLATTRTQLAVDTATAAARARREQIYADLSHIATVSAQALSCDRALYWLLRDELRAVQESAQFAAQFRAYAQDERAATAARVASMNEITSSQEQATNNLKNTDTLLSFLSTVLGLQGVDDITILSKQYAECSELKEIKEDVKQRYREKEDALRQLKASIQPLKDYIFDGCTRKPNCYDRTMTSLAHSLKQEFDRVEKTVMELGGQFASVMNDDKQNLRKLWQWFLTDPARMRAALNTIQTPGTVSPKRRFDSMP